MSVTSTPPTPLASASACVPRVVIVVGEGVVLCFLFGCFVVCCTYLLFWFHVVCCSFSVWFILLSDVQLSFECLLIVVFFSILLNLELFDICDFFSVFINIFS